MKTSNKSFPVRVNSIFKGLSSREKKQEVTKVVPLWKTMGKYGDIPIHLKTWQNSRKDRVFKK